MHLLDNLKAAIALRKINVSFKGQLISLRDTSPDPQKSMLVFQPEGYIFSPREICSSCHEFRLVSMDP